jgi:hypothetical protein
MELKEEIVGIKRIVSAKLETSGPKLTKFVRRIILPLNDLQFLNVLSAIRVVRRLSRERVVEVQPRVQKITALGSLNPPRNGVLENRGDSFVERFISPISH